jgi:hypothetical protein
VIFQPCNKLCDKITGIIHLILDRLLVLLTLSRHIALPGRCGHGQVPVTMAVPGLVNGSCVIRIPVQGKGLSGLIA